ncbi:MAG: hypothetical protein FJ029_14285 [Actinobacteria bacterium]|nr:hypothetical protein [Actinomycetota bacterium]
MRFWDSSAVVPLFVEQPSAPVVRAALAQDRALLVWWATRMECAAAIARLERERSLARKATVAALPGLDELAAGWHEIQPAEGVRRAARRLVHVHNLRAAERAGFPVVELGRAGAIAPARMAPQSRQAGERGARDPSNRRPLAGAKGSG